MQDRYVGDIGDFVKLALLRALACDRRLGIVWYRAADEAHNADGRHIAYLQDSTWRRLDTTLFDELAGIVERKERSLESLERANLLPACQFFSEHLPNSESFRERPALRSKWLTTAITKMNACDFVFLDPDNGLEPDSFKPRSKASIKSATLAEIQSFNKPGRTLVLYHHHTRRAGGHIEEIRHVAGRLSGSNSSTPSRTYCESTKSRKLLCFSSKVA